MTADLPEAPAGQETGISTAHDINEAELRDLLNRAAIREVLFRYSRAADRCDEELLRSCYHRDAVDRHGRFAGTAEEYVPWAIQAQRTGSIMTQHSASNVVIELASTVAWVESTFMATHIRPPSDEFDEPFVDTFWGRYVDRFEKRGGVWAIASREVVHDWSERRPCGPRMPHVETYRAGRRDLEDASYER
jgi:hypothetical protein